MSKLKNNKIEQQLESHKFQSHQQFQPYSQNYQINEEGFKEEFFQNNQIHDRQNQNQMQKQSTNIQIKHQEEKYSKKQSNPEHQNREERKQNQKNIQNMNRFSQNDKEQSRFHQEQTENRKQVQIHLSQLQMQQIYQEEIDEEIIEKYIENDEVNIEKDIKCKSDKSSQASEKLIKKEEDSQQNASRAEETKQKLKKFQEYQRILATNTNIEKKYTIEKLKEMLLARNIELSPRNQSTKYEENLQIKVINHSLNNSILILEVTMYNLKTNISILNMEQASPFHQNEKQTLKIDVESKSGGFGEVMLCEGRSKFAVKCLKMYEKSIMELDNKKQLYIQMYMTILLEAIKEVFCLKIADALEIGPSLKDRSFQFDIIAYKYCIQFQMEACAPMQQYSQKDIKDLKNAVKTLHLLNFIHADIKPGNILYSRVFKRAVFIDFGLSMIIKEGKGQQKALSFLGSHQFCCEEMQRLHNKKTSGLIDLYYNDAVCLQNTFKAMVNLNDPYHLVNLNNKMQEEILMQEELEYKYEDEQEFMDFESEENYQQKFNQLLKKQQDEEGCVDHSQRLEILKLITYYSLLHLLFFNKVWSIKNSKANIKTNLTAHEKALIVKFASEEIIFTQRTLIFLYRIFDVNQLKPQEFIKKIVEKNGAITNQQTTSTTQNARPVGKKITDIKIINFEWRKAMTFHFFKDKSGVNTLLQKNKLKFDNSQLLCQFLFKESKLLIKQNPELYYDLLISYISLLNNRYEVTHEARVKMCQYSLRNILKQKIKAGHDSLTPHRQILTYLVRLCLPEPHTNWKCECLTMIFMDFVILKSVSEEEMHKIMKKVMCIRFDNRVRILLHLKLKESCITNEYLTDKYQKITSIYEDEMVAFLTYIHKYQQDQKQGNHPQRNDIQIDIQFYQAYKFYFYFLFHANQPTKDDLHEYIFKFQIFHLFLNSFKALERHNIYITASAIASIYDLKKQFHRIASLRRQGVEPELLEQFDYYQFFILAYSFEYKDIAMIHSLWGKLYKNLRSKQLMQRFKVNLMGLSLTSTQTKQEWDQYTEILIKTFNQDQVGATQVAWIMQQTFVKTCKKMYSDQMACQRYQQYLISSCKQFDYQQLYSFIENNPGIKIDPFIDRIGTLIILNFKDSAFLHEIFQFAKAEQARIQPMMKPFQVNLSFSKTKYCSTLQIYDVSLTIIRITILNMQTHPDNKMQEFIKVIPKYLQFFQFQKVVYFAFSMIFEEVEKSYWKLKENEQRMNDQDDLIKAKETNKWLSRNAFLTKEDHKFVMQAFWQFISKSRGQQICIHLIVILGERINLILMVLEFLYEKQPLDGQNLFFKSIYNFILRICDNIRNTANLQMVDSTYRQIFTFFRTITKQYQAALNDNASNSSILIRKYELLTQIFQKHCFKTVGFFNSNSYIFYGLLLGLTLVPPVQRKIENLVYEVHFPLMKAPIKLLLLKTIYFNFRKEQANKPQKDKCHPRKMRSFYKKILKVEKIQSHIKEFNQYQSKIVKLKSTQRNLLFKEKMLSKLKKSYDCIFKKE